MNRNSQESDLTAPAGMLWVCHACGKTSPHKYGHPEASRGWDVSCMLNSALHTKDSLVYTSGPDEKSGRVKEIRE